MEPPPKKMFKWDTLLGDSRFFMDDGEVLLV